MYPRNKSVAICVAGWHYNKEFYSQLGALAKGDIFVISHQPASRIPAYLSDFVPAERVFVEPNLGYDWGCYQQFLAKGLWRKFDHIVFMHDDVCIKKAGFIEQCVGMLEQYAVVGNGRVGMKSDHPKRLGGCYAHSLWKPPSRAFQHDVVRGSFFATRRDALERLERFEVFWDPFHLSSHYGNWSTRASCAKLEFLFPDHCHGFLSESACESDYLLELVRGGVEEDAHSVPKRWIIQLIARYCGMYMSIYWSQKRGTLRPALLPALSPLISLVSGVRHLSGCCLPLDNS